ncbi:MAG TPA: serine/threonine-protein kinase [Polyangiaceae bacterium]
MTAQNSEPTEHAVERSEAGRGEDAGAPGDALPQIGSVLGGKYRIERELGRGGMGVVLLGHQQNLDRRVAIKVLRGSLAEQARSSQRFAREALAIAKLESEHVVRVFDAGEDGGVPYIVMEYLEGHDLAAELAAGSLPPSRAVEYLRQACEPIIEAHSLGIVHRDLKPSNLFLAKSKGKESLKVLDFGVSKWLGPAPGADTPLATREDSMIGTPAYVSPEQLVDPKSVDGRTDVWALGVVLYQCLTGKLPFRADSVPRLSAAILSAEPTAFDPGTGIPAPLREITLRCLKKDPAERFQTVEELDRALSRFNQGSMAPVARTPVAISRSTLPVIAGVATLVLAFGFAYARWSNPARDAAPAPLSSASSSSLAEPRGASTVTPPPQAMPPPALDATGPVEAEQTPPVRSSSSATARVLASTRPVARRAPSAPDAAVRKNVAAGEPTAAAKPAPAPSASAPAPIVEEGWYRH